MRTALIGTGWSLRVQLPAFRAAGLPVTALWSRDAAKAARLAAEHGIPFASDRVESVLARPDADLAVIATPPLTHREVAVDALAAGKHVLCEKPTALASAEAAEMQAAAAAHPDRLALIDHELRFLPELGELRRRLALGTDGRDGGIGELFRVGIRFANSFRLGDRTGWDWWSSAAAGGGMLGAIGSHLLDLVGWLTGRAPVALVAQLAVLEEHRRDQRGHEHRVTSDDACSLLLRLEGGIPVSLDITAGAGPPGHRITVEGTSGTLSWRETGRLTLYRPGDGEHDITPPAANAPLPAGLPDSEWARGTLQLARALAAWSDGDAGALDHAATFADGLTVQRLLDAARRSADERRWIEL